MWNIYTKMFYIEYNWCVIMIPFVTPDIRSFLFDFQCIFPIFRKLNETQQQLTLKNRCEYKGILSTLIVVGSPFLLIKWRVWSSERSDGAEESWNGHTLLADGMRSLKLRTKWWSWETWNDLTLFADWMRSLKLRTKWWSW